MTPTQRLAVSLTSLDAARAMLLKTIGPVAPVELPLLQALGCVAAELPPLELLPPFDVAAVDGWALHARELVGASSYSPLPLAVPPVWVEAGDRMPEGRDCVIDPASVEQAGPLFQVLADAVPWQGVRRAGGDITERDSLIAAGRQIRALDLLTARMAGLARLAVRRPRLRVIDIPATGGNATTAQLIAESAGVVGADVVCAKAAGRDARSIANAVDAESCDLIITIGGSGIGRTDATAQALAQRGALLAHGIALQPGRTAAIGKIASSPVIALPGAADQALAGWWTLALPVLERLSGRESRPMTTLPLVRKIASSVGIAEIALLKRAEDAWMPLAIGDLALDTIAIADAWLAVPGGSEGYAAGTAVDAYMLRDCS
ncbi:molybdopterin-binding protein [uncultured Bradyrhizobium sp.]|uniref:molybdopterin-binding protein n=1 Tax=uncultured Bradyrhizobium sp. TaxID=199684 RepID=UPI0035CB79EE